MNRIKAAFFDRDGTLIKDVPYLSDLSQIEILPGAIELCSFLQNLGFKLFVVTNQSGVARGFFDENFIKEAHNYLKKLFLNKGIFFERFYYCPHHPTKSVKIEYLKNCFCRKPNPGMLLKAAHDFNIDLSKSLMFGDKLTDIQVGLSVGCKSFYINEFFSCSNYDKFEFQSSI